MQNQIKGILFDWDGSIVPQGGCIDSKVAAFFRFMHGLGIKMGPATGKNDAYMRGAAVGIGIPMWSFIVAETAGVILKLTEPGPPPIFEQIPLSETGRKDIAALAYHIKFNQFLRQFEIRGEKIKYRPELKETMITIFPPGKDLSVTEPWKEHFEKVIQTHGLELAVHRHSDGCIDIVPKDISKRRGVLRICELLDCKPENILTVVDGENDFELAEGTTAIAVGNAKPSLKELVARQGGFVADFLDGCGFMQGAYHFALSGAFGEASKTIVEYLDEIENWKR